MFSRRSLPLVLLLALALLGAACGSDSDAPDVPAGAVAVVGDQEITKAEFDRLVAQAERNFEAQEQEFPAAGTPEYENLKNAIVKSLVDQAEWEQQSAEMGISVSDEEVDKRLEELKKQFFEGDEKKYADELEKQGLTEEQVRKELRARILSEKVYEAVTKDVKVTNADIQAYYAENKAQFEQPQSRDVRHILVKTKAKAEDLHRRVRGGADFARLAKRFSEDSTSAAEGGKLTAVKGRTVAPFDEFVFGAETGDLSQPIKTEFGWHVIEVLTAVKPASTTPLAEVSQSIRDTLLQQKQNEAMRRWVQNLGEEFEGRVAYAAGYAPPASSETTTTGATTSSE